MALLLSQGGNTHSIQCRGDTFKWSVKFHQYSQYGSTLLTTVQQLPYSTFSYKIFRSSAFNIQTLLPETTALLYSFVETYILTYPHTFSSDRMVGWLVVRKQNINSVNNITHFKIIESRVTFKNCCQQSYFTYIVCIQTIVFYAM